MDRVTARADTFVLRLKIKAPVKIEGRAIFIKLRSNPTGSSKDEVDLLRPGKESPSNCTRPDTFWALAFFPLELRKQRARLDWDSQNDFVLDDKARHGLPDNAGLRSEQSEEQGHQLEDRPRDHLPPAAITLGFAVKR